MIDRIHDHLWFVLDMKQKKRKLKMKIIFFVREISPKYLAYFHMRTNAFRTAIETAINLHLNSIYL